VIERIGRITGAAPLCVEADVRDERALARVFAEHPVDGVIHFAALKAVGESVREPLRYYDNNVSGTLTLLRAMQAAGVQTLVFSSSATVYGDPASVPIREDFPLSATNPYGWSKLMMEQMLADLDEHFGVDASELRDCFFQCTHPHLLDRSRPILRRAPGHSPLGFPRRAHRAAPFWSAARH